MAGHKTTQLTFFIIFAVLFLTLTPTSSHSVEVSVTFKGSDTYTSGYKIHYGLSSRNYQKVIDVGLPTQNGDQMSAPIAGLLEGKTYYFAATAYSESEESDYSAEVVFTVPIQSRSVPPVVNDVLLNGNQDTTISGTLEVTTTDETGLQFTIVSQPSHGTLSLVENSGYFIYVPTPAFYGTDFFSYTASNSEGTSRSATVTILLDSANDADAATNTIYVAKDSPSYDDSPTDIPVISANENSEAASMSASSQSIASMIAVINMLLL